MTSDADGRMPASQPASETAISALCRRFEDMLPGLVAQISADIAALGGDEAERPAILARLRAAVHDLKGQGSSFGYPLITEFSASLSTLLFGLRDVDDAAMARIALHGDLLAAIATHRIRGDGGEMGLALRAGLSRAMA